MTERARPVVAPAVVASRAASSLRKPQPQEPGIAHLQKRPTPHHLTAARIRTTLAHFGSLPTGTTRFFGTAAHARAHQPEV